MADSSASGATTDPFLAHTRAVIHTFIALQTERQLKAEVRQVEATIRANPARLQERKAELKDKTQRAKEAGAKFHEAELACARSLRDLFTFSGRGRPAAFAGAGVGATSGGASGSGGEDGGGIQEHKPNASFVQYLELNSQLSALEKKHKDTADKVFTLLKGFSAIHDTLLRIANLAERAYNPGSWSGPGSASEAPTQHTTTLDPILTLDHNTDEVSKRLSKTHLGLLFAAARRSTASEHGQFQFIPYDPSHPIHQRLRSGNLPFQPPHAPPHSSNGGGGGSSSGGPYVHLGQQDQQQDQQQQQLTAIIPWDSPTEPNDADTVARRLDRLAADFLELAHAVDRFQNSFEHEQRQLEDDRALLQLALESGVRTRAQLSALVEGIVELGADGVREDMVARGMGPSSSGAAPPPPEAAATSSSSSRGLGAAGAARGRGRTAGHDGVPMDEGEEGEVDEPHDDDAGMADCHAPVPPTPISAPQSGGGKERPKQPTRIYDPEMHTAQQSAPRSGMAMFVPAAEDVGYKVKAEPQDGW